MHMLIFEHAFISLTDEPLKFMASNNIMEAGLLDGISRPNPSFKTVFSEYFKKSFLVHKRSKSVIISFVIALIIWLPLIVVSGVGKINFAGDEDPQVQQQDFLFKSLLIFFKMQESTKFYLVPDSDNVRTVIEPSFKLIVGLINASATFSYSDDADEVLSKEIINDEAGILIYWKNSREQNAFTDPDIEVYVQSSYSYPDLDLFTFLRQAIAKSINSTDEKVTDLNKLVINTQNFPYPSYSTVLPIGITYALFALLPLLVLLLSELQSIVLNKAEQVTHLMFLMGLPETCYWLVSFIFLFVQALIAYLIITCLFVFKFGLKGTSFTLFFVITLLFILSSIFFSFWFSTYMKKKGHLIAFLIVLFILVYLLDFVISFYVLDDKYKLESLKYILSLFPFSSYQMIIMTIYNECAAANPSIGWSDVFKDIQYPVWMALFWLTIDTILYFGLFVISNLTAKRPFGTPLLSFKEIFSLTAWKRVLKKNDKTIHPEYPIAIQADRMTKKFNKDTIVALDDVSLEIKNGEIIVLIGPNGAGKSTMINILTGSLDPTEGSLSLYGSELTSRFNIIQEYLGIVFQNNILHETLSFQEHMELFGTLRGYSKAEIPELTPYFADKLHMSDCINSRAGDMSGGQKRKLCIAMSLLGNPPIIVMDEPTAGVDVQSRQLIWKIIAELTNTTSIITCHALEEAEAVCSRIFIMSKGKMPFVGTSTDLRKQFNCGYLLRLDTQDGNINNVLQLAQNYVADARISDERADTIWMPVESTIPQFLVEFESKLNEFGVNSYSFTVEQLEDILLKMIQSEEVAT